jgi:hypothetical protein
VACIAGHARRLIRRRGWRRPRLRLHPAKPKVGLRTTAPSEAWHVDVTILKLLDGTKAYVHAVIDNLVLQKELTSRERFSTKTQTVAAPDAPVPIAAAEDEKAQ